MLRSLFQESKRKDSGLLKETESAIAEYRRALKRSAEKNRSADAAAERLRLDIWARGFADALDELEQSLFCASKYAERVQAFCVEEMSEAEQDDYRRHLYFYKNGFIRLFSILDKLGYFLNDRYALHTDKIKSKFSYFTVLRRMHETKALPELEAELIELKNSYRDQLARLRSQRNMEIHHLNAEIVDDMLRAKARSVTDERQRVENLQDNLRDLAQGFEMVCRTLLAVFHYAKRKNSL